MSEFVKAVKDRRTIYALGNDPGITQEAIVARVTELLDAVPSAFNNQSQRVAVLFGDQHDLLWAIVKDVLRSIVPAAKFPKTEEKLKGFEAAYGTILFFNDQSVTDKMMQQFPSYAKHFPIWAEEALGMLEFAVWTGLEEMGLGVNIQHYNPLINDRVMEEFELPSTWVLDAQMLFGKKLAEPGKKEIIPAKDRMMVFYDRHPKKK